MHVGAPRMMRSPDHPARLRLAAKIEYQGRLAPSDELWFEFDEALEESISTSGSPWLLAALPLAFARGEPLSVEAQVDPVLVANAQALQTVWAGWYPRFQPIELRVDPQSQASKSAGRSACFFSGGVDSYYTMLHSRGSGGPAIDDLLLVHGFDISIGEQAGWLQARDSALAASRAWGTPLITIGTNLRATRFREVHWDRLGSGPALGSVATRKPTHITRPDQRPSSTMGIGQTGSRRPSSSVEIHLPCSTCVYAGSHPAAPTAGGASSVSAP
jgi:hypothetical protein